MKNDLAPLIRADVWKELTTISLRLRSELGYSNYEVAEFLKTIAKEFEKGQI